MKGEQLAVSVDRAAEIISLGRNATYLLIMSGEIPSYKCGARRIVPLAGLRDYVERRTAEAEVAV